MDLITIIALIGLIPAAIAQKKGRSFVGWWVYGSAIFIVALPHALLLKPDQRSIEQRRLSAGDVRKCPFCAELVKFEAKVCKHCAREF